MSISNNISIIEDNIPNSVQLVAVSKTKPNSYIIEAYNTGHRVFGENRPQELKQKYNELPKDIEWHFIGHPQSKQVKYFAPFVSLIHGIDSLKLLQTINKEAIKNSRVINCLLQFHVAEESSKFGLNISGARHLLNDNEFLNLKNINICGVMGMATHTNNPEQIKIEFRTLKSIFTELKQKFFTDNNYFTIISMGMSSDYELAIKEGSNMVRVGSGIFGIR